MPRKVGPAALPSGLVQLEVSAAGVLRYRRDREKLRVVHQREACCLRTNMTAAARVVGSDGTITVREAELYRALAVSIGCPLSLLTAAA